MDTYFEFITNNREFVEILDNKHTKCRDYLKVFIKKIFDINTYDEGYGSKIVNYYIENISNYYIVNIVTYYGYNKKIPEEYDNFIIDTHITIFIYILCIFLIIKSIITSIMKGKFNIIYLVFSLIYYINCMKINNLFLKKKIVNFFI